MLFRSKTELALLLVNLEKYIDCNPVRSILSNMDFSVDRKAIHSALRKNPKINLQNGELLWKITSEANFHYHCLPAGTGFAWCRTTDVLSAHCLSNFEKNRDYFLELDFFVVFVLQQLRDFGDDVDGFLSLRSGVRPPVNTSCIIGKNGKLMKETDHGIISTIGNNIENNCIDDYDDYDKYNDYEIGRAHV